MRLKSTFWKLQNLYALEKREICSIIHAHYQFPNDALLDALNSVLKKQ